MSENSSRVTLTGTVISGDGEAREFVSLPGYMEQFREKLGYEPYPGTLNVLLDETSTRKRTDTGTWRQITIDGWERDGRSFGPVYCTPARLTVVSTSDTERTVHAIYPERTRHDLDTLELIAPVSLRDRYGLDDGDEITVETERR